MRPRPVFPVRSGIRLRGLVGVNGGVFRTGSSARKVESLSLFSMGVSETGQNSEIIERHPKQVGINEIFLDLGSSG